MKLESLQAAEKTLLLQTYERNPILFVSGNGVYLRDEKGNDYLDLLSGIGVSALGYGHPAIEQRDCSAIEAAAAYFESVLPRAHSRACVAADGDLRARSRVLLQQRHRGLGGRAEACARSLGEDSRGGWTSGTKFLALEHSFHGRTMGSVATTHKEKYREPFAPVMPDVEFVRFNDVADLKCKVLGRCLRRAALSLSRAKAAFTRSRRSSLRRLVNFAIRLARC